MDLNIQIIMAIQAYLSENNLALRPIANQMGTTYQKLYQKIYNRLNLDVGTYAEFCMAINVPMEYFIEKAKEI